MVTTPEVRAAVGERLGARADASEVKVVPVGASSAFDIVVRASDAKGAATVANAYADSYVELRRKQVLDDLDAAEREIQAKIDGLQAEIDALVRPSAATPPEERASLQQTTAVRQSSLISSQAAFRQQLDQLQIARALRTGGVRVTTPAVPVSSPVEPLVTRNVLIGASSGLCLGFALALLLPIAPSAGVGEEPKAVEDA